MKEVRIGLIGYGLAGATFHAPLIASVEGMTLARVASSNEAKVKQDFPDAEVSADPMQVIHAADVDLVVLATPNLEHFRLAKEALLAGKHVVVEKPFTVTVEEGEELLRLAHECGRLLSVFQNRRWDNDFLTVRRCIESGALGAIVTYEAHFDRYRPDVRKRWREENLPGSGTLYDLGAHLIDQALVLFGLPETVSADVGTQRQGAQAGDYFHLMLGYGTLRVILHSGFIVRQPGPHFQVHGRSGSFIKYGLDPQEDALRAGQRPGGNASWGVEPPALHGQLTLDRNGEAATQTVESLPGRYQAFYQGMYDAITAGAPLPVEASDGLNVIRVIESALSSSREKRVIAFA